MFGQMVGIDIGESQVKLVHMAGGRIKKAVTAQLPDNMVENGVIRSMDAMADFLRITAKENGIPRRNAAIILPEELVFSRNVTLPVMTASQLNYNLPYEFKDYLVLEKEKYFYDYAMFGTNQESGEMELFACAVLKSTIADYRAMLRRAGFKLKVALPEQWAYVSALRYCGVEGTVCLADLGHGKTRVHVFKDGRPDSRRIVELGIQDVDQVIADSHHVDIHMARTYKRSDFGGCLTADGANRLYEKLGVEILKTVNFYNYNHREQALKALCLCGGGAQIQPLRQAVARVTGLQVLPLQELLPELEGMEEYIKAFGCAVNQ